MAFDEGKPKSSCFLVDDHPLVREWLANLINQQSDLAVCGEAASAAEARQSIARLQPDVAVVDIVLKDANGLELIKDLKKVHPDLAILVLSMHDEGLYAERALRAGAQGYIAKCETTNKVIDAIRTVRAGKLYLGEAVSQSILAKFVDGQPLAPLSPLELLSDRELEVFNLLGQGLGTRRIGETLRISSKTVQSYCARIKEKLKLGSLMDLIREAIRHAEATLSK